MEPAPALDLTNSLQGDLCFTAKEGQKGSDVQRPGFSTFVFPSLARIVYRQGSSHSNHDHPAQITLQIPTKWPMKNATTSLWKQQVPTPRKIHCMSVIVHIIAK